MARRLKHPDYYSRKTAVLHLSFGEAGRGPSGNFHPLSKQLKTSHIHIFPLNSETRETQHRQALPGEIFFSITVQFLYHDAFFRLAASITLPSFTQFQKNARAAE